MSENKNNNDEPSFQNLPGVSSFDLEDIEKRLKDARERTTEFVKEYPLISVSIAVGVGFLLCKLVSRKNE